jgi:thermitase
LIISAQPELTNNQVMNIITKSAIDLGDRGKDEDFGNGLIDVNSALQMAKMNKPKNANEKFNGRLFNYFR